MVQLGLIGLGVVLLAALATAKVPPYIHVCSRNDPNINKCVVESVHYLIPKLKQGIPELDVPALEPLTVDEIALADLEEFRAIARNVRLGGLSNFTVKQLQVDLKNQKIDLEVVFPRVTLDSDYDVKAKIIVPINEKGPINTVTENVVAKVAMKFQTLERRGRKLMYFPSMTTKLTITDYQANFKPGAGKDNPLVEAINTVLVNSSKEIIESMTPNIEKAISTKVLEVSNRICKHFSYDELFPDNP